MTSYNKQNIANMLFLDIETVREYNTYAEFISVKSIENWKKVAAKYYGDFLASEVDIKDEDIYLSRAPLHPEYAKIVCISFGFMILEGGVYTKKIYSISDIDEVNLLLKFADQLNKAFDKNLNTLICGHNVLEFDIPFIIKRMIKHSIKIPVILQNVINSKPWETKVIDTLRDWKMNSNKQMVSLDTIAEFLGIESSKSGVVSGSTLSKYYWELGAASLPEIANYCKRDISVSMEIVKKFEQV